MSGLPESGPSSCRVDTTENRHNQTFPRGLDDKNTAASIADEIVGGGGMAKQRPAFRAPVIDEARLAHERLEPLRLAHRGIGGTPERSRVDSRKVTRVDIAFIKIENTAGGTNVKVDPVQIPQAREGLRRGRGRRGRAQETRSSFLHSSREVSPRGNRQGICGF